VCDPHRDRVVVCVAPPRRLSFMSHGDLEKRAIMGDVVATGWKASSLCKSKINAKKTLRQLGSNDPRVFTVSLLACVPK